MSFCGKCSEMFCDVQFMSGETCNWVNFHKSGEPEPFILCFFSGYRNKVDKWNAGRSWL